MLKRSIPDFVFQFFAYQVLFLESRLQNAFQSPSACCHLFLKFPLFRDPIRNAKVDATSTVYAVVQIGLRGGIFQYTNALKVLGKPSQVLTFDEAFFCYRGSTLIDQDKCSKDDFLRSSQSTAPLPPSTPPAPAPVPPSAQAASAPTPTTVTSAPTATS